MNFWMYIKRTLAALHAVGGSLSVFVISIYLFYGLAGNGVFEPALQGVLPVMGIALVVGMHTLNAAACFSVAYSLWQATKRGRLLVFIYDGLVFAVFLALSTFSLFGPSTARLIPSFLLFSLFVLLTCGATIIVCFQEREEKREK